jgi:epimerase transport system membrane fusion protein
MTAQRPSDSSRGATIVGIAMLAAFFGGLGGWAAIGQLDRAVIAPGVVIVEGNRFEIAHRDGGTVAEVLVREGAAVAAGDLLVRLDTNEIEARVSLLQVRALTAEARTARLNAERTEARDILFSDVLLARAADPAVAAVLIQETELFRARRTALAGNLAIYEQQVAGLIQERNGLEARRRAQIARIDSTREQLAAVTALFNQGLYPRVQVIDIERDVALAEGERDALTAALARSDESVRETRLRIDQLRKQRAEEIATGLREATDQLRALEPELAAATQTVARAEVRAPVSGYVLGLAVTSRGNVVRPGDRVLDLVPSGGTLVIEARISPDDVEAIHPRLDAQIRLTSFRYPMTPLLNGRVEVVSADRMVDERTGMPFYRAQIALMPGEVERAGVEILPGLPAEVTIAIGERTPLAYLLQPITTTLRRGMREE